MATSRTTRLHLPHQGIHSVADGSGVEFVCSEGSLWLTVDGDPEDYIIGPGERFSTIEPKRVVLYALADSRLEIVARQSRKLTMAMFNRFQPSPLMNAAR
jgi:hypothetical protein